MKLVGFWILFILVLGLTLCHRAGSVTNGSGENPGFRVTCTGSIDNTSDLLQPFTTDGSGSENSCDTTDINECAENLADCVTEALCMNTIGNYSCICPGGYTGDGRVHGNGCMDIDECNGLHDCLAGATCRNGNGSYSCDCPSGYRGDGRWPWFGQGCVDINECTEGSSECLREATCVNTGGGYYCTCPAGYYGDGRQNGVGCVDIDECAVHENVNSLNRYNYRYYNNYDRGCMTGAICRNIPGSYACSCPDGYTGDGRWFSSGCNDINECVTGTHSCTANEICVNTQGSFRCEYNAPTEGFEYLKFMNIFADDGVTLEQLEAIPWYRAFTPVYVDGGIPVGTRIETTAYISANGVISFGDVWPYWYPYLFPIPSYYWQRGIFGVVAPFWNSVDLQREGDVAYKVYSAGVNNKSDELLDYVSRFVSARDQRAANFSGTWMLVVDWNSVPPYPQYNYHYYLYDYYNYYYYNSYSYYYSYYRNYYSRQLEFFTKRNTYQAMIITDSTETYTVFSYNCDFLQWTGYWRHAAIGYSVQAADISTDFDPFVNHPLSLRTSIRDVACQNMANNIPWSNIVYKIGESKTTIQQLRAQCKKMYQKDIQTFPNLRPIQNSLLPCPCSVWQIWWDRRYLWFSYFYGDNRACFVQRFPSGHGASQLCCYSYEGSTFGALVGADKFSGSSILRYHPYRFPSSYETYDEDFRDICCGAADLCQVFYSRRPPDDCSRYRPPRWTWGRGDPHITTLDGRQYTFNGWGEYILILLNGSDFMLQCRTDPVVNSTATRFSGFAFGVRNDSVVEITSDVNSSEMRLLYNSVDISSNVTSINDTYSGNMVEITRTDNTSLLSIFNNGLAVTISVSLMGMMNIVVNLPVEYDSQTQGLMGNFNGNSTDDFILPNGSMLDDGASDRMIHSFGQAWEVNAEESLFTYPDGLSADNFSHPDHIPDFLDEVLANADPQTRELCNGNAECIFDVSQTGNEDIGMATLEFDSNTRQSQMEATNEPPRMIGPSTFMVTLDTISEYVFNVTDTDSFNVSLGEEILDEYLTQDGDLFTFTWNLTEFENMTLIFIARDSLGAISFLQPQLLVCPCQNDGNCTTGGLLDITANPLLMNCLCNPAWTGRFCEQDADGCLQSPCAAGVNCTDIPAPDIGATCGPCPSGFSGDGQECLDVDECSLSTDGCEQECVNTEGSFTCQCFPNYRLINTTSCEDIDECSLLNGGCHQVCTNTEGSYYCSCNEGYQLQENNFTCAVRPEYTCPRGNGCDQECVLVNGVNQCSCDSGYQLTNDGLTCIDINECQVDPLVCSQICNNTDGGYSCDCHSGYTLAEDGISCDDVDECVEAALAQRMICPHSAYCVNVPGGYECTCPGDTLLLDGECIQPIAATTVPEPPATAVEPSTAPIPVPSRLSTLHYIVIAAVSATVIILGLVMIMICTNTCKYGKCCKGRPKRTRVEPAVTVIENHNSDQIEMVPVSISDFDTD